jgi:hypothetical protein
MFQSKKYLWLFWGLCGLGILMGLVVDDDELSNTSPHECRVEAAIVFVSLLSFMLLCLLLQRGVVGLERFFVRVAGRQPTSSSSFSFWPDSFFRYAGWFFLFFGIGFAMSAIWRGADRFWEGLVFFAAGAGSLIGCLIPKWISKKAQRI